MDKIIRQFVESINNRPHLSPLFHMVTIRIIIETENESFAMQIKDNEITAAKGQMNDRDVYIKIEEDRLTDLLYGKIKLRQVAKERKATVTGFYRNILFAESLFLLGMEKKERC